ncbi:hypothetical protein MNBD_ALPHA06-531 [hydrothermal vent metagenome]|uniref:Chorismate mutase domain-containing protein n=1 Tax=hydrothermal vent metagenome TaxID=652676 RepID=A0A3B0S9T7_9ZZZZ
MTDISSVRDGIDAIDDALLKLINQRLELAKSLRQLKPKDRAAWAPDREHKLLQRLLDHKSPNYPPETLVAMWSALIACSLLGQGPLVILSGSANMQALGEAAFPGASHLPLDPDNWQQQIIDTPGAIGVMAYPDPDNIWWSELQQDEAALRVQTCLPKWPPDQRKAVCISSGTAPVRPGQVGWFIYDAADDLPATTRQIASANGRVLVEEHIEAQDDNRISLGNFFASLQGEIS